MCLSIDNFDWICFKTGKNYHPQVFLKECKYIVKEKNIPDDTTDDIEISSDDSGEENSFEKNYN